MRRGWFEIENIGFSHMLSECDQQPPPFSTSWSHTQISHSGVSFPGLHVMLKKAVKLPSSKSLTRVNQPVGWPRK